MLKPGLLRFILALTVIFFHISKLIFLGHFAVLCFFMLSGYWITFMYKNKYQKFEDVFKVFYISRVWRLFPVFLLFNILVFAVSYIYNPHFFDFFLAFKTSEKLGYGLSNIFLLGFYQFKNQILVPAWSLDIEMQFYLIYPFLFFFVIKAELLVNNFFSDCHRCLKFILCGYSDCQNIAVLSVLFSNRGLHLSQKYSV